MTNNPYIDDIFEKKTKISYSSLDSRGQLKIISILNFFQDTAAEHASDMGISGFDLAKQNFAWVISSYQIKIIKSPQWNDEILIKTWRIPFKNLYELRFFTIQDKNGTDMIEATGTWIMVKKENSRPVRLSRFIPDTPLCKNRINPVPSSCDTPGIKTQGMNQKLKLPEKIHCKLPFKVRMQDLDMNQHVNNAIYIEWAVETLPEDFIGVYRPAQVDVSFHKPSFYGDTILSSTEILKDPSAPVTRHSIIREKKDAPVELARINITWAPIEHQLS